MWYPGHLQFQLLCCSNCWGSLVFSPPSQTFRCPHILLLRLLEFRSSWSSPTPMMSVHPCLLPAGRPQASTYTCLDSWASCQTTSSFSPNHELYFLCPPLPISAKAFGSSQSTGGAAVGCDLTASWPSVTHFIIFERQWEGGCWRHSSPKSGSSHRLLTDWRGRTRLGHCRPCPRAMLWEPHLQGLSEPQASSTFIKGTVPFYRR